jgi:hypothetical protein
MQGTRYAIERLSEIVLFGERELWKWPANCLNNLWGDNPCPDRLCQNPATLAGCHGPESSRCAVVERCRLAR